MSEHSTILYARGIEVSPCDGRRFRKYRYWTTVLILAATDALSFLLAAALFRFGHVPPKLAFFPGASGEQTPVDIFLVLGVIFILARYFFGDYSHRQLFWDSARATTAALVITSVPYLIILALAGELFSSFAVLGSWTFLLVAVPTMRQLARLAMTYAGLWRLPTALIASGARTADVFDALSGTLSLGFDLRWIVLENYSGEPTEKVKHLKRVFLTDPADVIQKLAESGCSQAVIVTDDMQSVAFANLIQRLIEADVPVAFTPSSRRLIPAGASSSYFFGHDILMVQVRNNLHRFQYRFMKRAFDIVGSLALLILFSPLIFFLIVAIRCHDGGPAIYSHKRTGRHGVPFLCLKFRTMAVDADERLEHWRLENSELYQQFLKSHKLQDDPRITELGKWLRRTSLDELPQLLNVLCGEMSLVGPRPVPECELIEHYGSVAQLYKRVRPGLTGLWQISGRCDTTYAQRVDYDEWYILNWSFWYDIVIILRTALSVVHGKGAY